MEITNATLGAAIHAALATWLLYQVLRRVWARKFWIRHYIKRLEESNGVKTENAERAHAHWNFVIGFYTIWLLFTILFW